MGLFLQGIWPQRTRTKVMAYRSHSRVRRLLRVVALLLVCSAVYVFWPAQQIEWLSDTLSVEQKNDYIDSILNPEKNEIYDAGYDSLKAEFDPNNNNLAKPDFIDREKVNKALNKIKMKPLNMADEETKKGTSTDSENKQQKQNLQQEKQEEQVEKYNILSDTLTKGQFTPINSLLGFLGNVKESGSKKNYYKDLTCTDILYKNSSPQRTIEYGEPIHLDDDLIEIRKWLLTSSHQDILKAVDPKAKDGTYLSDITHWFKKSGSSVWLPDEQLHMMVSTVMYAPNDRSEPIVSFIRLQLFDTDWKEVKGRRIRYFGVDEKEIDTVLREYAKTGEDRHLERISLKFPSILNVPFEARKPVKGRTLGPEDPRILYKDGEYHSEPVIVFSMLGSNNKRQMYSVFPLSVPKNSQLAHPLLKFKNIGNNAVNTLHDNKNWIPFFDSVKIGDSKTSKGYMYFAYTFDPLVIFKCSLDSGKCKKTQDNVKYSKHVKDEVAYLRGGTSLVPVPRQIIQSLSDGTTNKRLQMWVGFPKTLIKSSNCGNQKIYRPILMLLIKDDGIFRVEFITSPLDFGFPTENECHSEDDGQASSISAHGISFWDIASTGMVPDGDASIPLYNDHMGILIGEGNKKIELIVLKNVLNYIMGIYSEKSVYPFNYGYQNMGTDNPDNGLHVRSLKACECALEASLLYSEAITGGSSSSANIAGSFEDKTTEEW